MPPATTLVAAPAGNYDEEYCKWSANGVGSAVIMASVTAVLIADGLEQQPGDDIGFFVAAGVFASTAFCCLVAGVLAGRAAFQPQAPQPTVQTV